MKVKFCKTCGTMHIERGDYCISCIKQQEEREKQMKPVLLRNKRKYARFEGGIQV